MGAQQLELRPLLWRSPRASPGTGTFFSLRSAAKPCKLVIEHEVILDGSLVSLSLLTI